MEGSVLAVESLVYRVFRLNSFRFVSLKVLKQMSLIATQRSLKTSRWNSLLKKKSPKWRNNPKQLSVIFPRASERYFVTSEEKKS